MIMSKRRKIKIARYIPGYGYMGYKKFVILTRSRTGSTLLAKLLNQHPEICCYYEQFARLNGKTVAGIWNDIFRPMPREIAWVGFKIFYYHPMDAAEDEKAEIWRRLIDDASIPVIHLMRRNKVRIAVSSEIAIETGEYHKKLRVDKKKIAIPIDTLRQHIDYTVNAESEFREKFGKHRMIEVYYEDLAKNTEAEIERIFEFMGLGKISIEMPLAHQNPERLSELLLNYEELKMEFASTEWEKYFE